MVSFWASSPHCFYVFLFSCLLFCFVYFFCRWNKLKLKPVCRSSVYDSFLEILERAYKNIKREDLLTAGAIGWGHGLLLRFSSLACCQMVENKTKNVGGHTISHLDIKYHLWWNFSPLPVQGSELSQGVDVNYVIPCLFVGGTYFTRTFPQLRFQPPSCQPRETGDVLYKNKEKLFSICPAPYSRKSETGPLQTTPHPRARRAVVARGITF